MKYASPRWNGFRFHWVNCHRHEFHGVKIEELRDLGIENRKWGKEIGKDRK